ncbi:MFS transporter [Yinghuangia soli]|uniref:MFS transporter n=1 Tax=Yinghuangia soli TaxID=2908204 RepID=A0AA41Q3E1_9ACTN|nr:MFS transporter [Yinghuangia soli]MCF2530482.1 MFS transporter [Yinghuangia soli]
MLPSRLLPRNLSRTFFDERPGGAGGMSGRGTPGPEAAVRAAKAPAPVAPAAPAPTGGSRTRTAWLTVAGILLIALNLRLAISSTAALLDQVRGQLGFGPAVASLVPALPVILFAFAGASSTLLARRLGTERALLAALGALAAGIAVRGIPGTGALLAGIVLGSAGLAVCNVLLPVVVRTHFPKKIALLTSLYTMAMSLGSAAAAAVAVPIANASGSASLGLAAWAIPAVIACVVWGMRSDSWRSAAAESAHGSVLVARPDTKVSALRVGRTRFGLLVTALFALQAMNSYAIIGWLPGILTDSGMSSSAAGSTLGVVLIVGVPATFLLMPLAATTRGLRVAFVTVAGALLAGYVGLLAAPSAAPLLWALLLGAGMSTFPLILAVIGRSGGSPQEAAALSTFAQSTGYLVAAVGPFMVGMVHSATGSWTLPLVLLIGATVLQLAVALALTARKSGRR